MSHRDRSINNMRCEAKRIYNQRRYINKLEQENKKIKDNWNNLKEGLRSLYDFDEGVVSKDYLECVEDTLDKMQEIEEKNDKRNMETN